MTYCSGFTRHQPCHANFKRIHSDSEETKTCCVKNDTKTIVVFYLKPVYGLNTCIYKIILIKTSSQMSKTRVGYINSYNNDFSAQWDCCKVFRLNKNNLLDNFSFTANWKCQPKTELWLCPEKCNGVFKSLQVSNLSKFYILT